MTRKEWIWVIIVAGLIIAASTVPYVTGYLSQTEEVRFIGSLINEADYHSYLAKMWQGVRGSWRYQLIFTPEEHEGAYLFTLYLALGHLARLTGLSLPLIYQIARITSGFAMLLLIYRFIAHFVTRVDTRQVAFLLATTASGLGWLTEMISPTLPGGISPLDFWMMSGYTYLTLLTFPHFCVAISLLLTIFLLLLHRPEGPTLRESVATLFASLALALIHPFTLVLVDLIPLLYWAIRWVYTRRIPWRGVATVVAMGLLTQLPIVLYDTLILYRRPIFSDWSAQNLTLSPPPRFYLLGYASLLVLGAIGAGAWLRRKEPKVTFPVIWIGLAAVFLYFPWNLQRRFTEAIQIPLGILAGVGLAEILFPAHRRRRSLYRIGLALVVALTAMSNIYFTAGATMATVIHSPVLFRSASVLEAIDWIGEHAAWDDTILSAYDTGSLIPARTGHRVVIGHPMETVNFQAKEAAVARFFAASTSDAARQRMIREWNVAYVFHGPEERALGDFDPSSAPWLVPVFEHEEVVIYRVDLEGP